VVVVVVVVGVVVVVVEVGGDVVCSLDGDGAGTTVVVGSPLGPVTPKSTAPGPVLWY